MNKHTISLHIKIVDEQFLRFEFNFLHQAAETGLYIQYITSKC